MKTTLLLLFFVLNFISVTVAQAIQNTFNKKTICDSLGSIDSGYFNKYFSMLSVIDSNNIDKKINHEIEVQFGNQTLRFKDNLSDENYFEYFLAGVDKKKNWVLVKGQDYNHDYYYLINQKLQTIDSLVGYPLLYNNRMICLEGEYTDGTCYIEIQELYDDKTKLISKFSFQYCENRPDYIALSDQNELLIKDRNTFGKYKLKEK